MKQHEFIKDIDENGNQSISVSDKPKRRLDLIPRLLCVFVAFFIWIWMVNLNDTDLTEKMTLDIEFVGATAGNNVMFFEQNGEEMVIYGIDKTNISLTVQGSNRDIRRFEDENKKVTIDLGKIDLSKTADNNELVIPLDLEIPEGSGLKIIESDQLSVSFFADKYLTDYAEIPMEVRPSETPNNAGTTYEFTYEILGGSEDGIIKLSGPEKIIKQISYVKVQFDGNFVNSNDNMVLTEIPLSFIGKDGKEIDTMNTVSCLTEGINIEISAKAIKTLHVIPTCESDDVIPIITGDSTITVEGPPSVVNKLSDYRINISASDAQVGKTYVHKPEIENASVKQSNITISFEAKTE